MCSTLTVGKMRLSVSSLLRSRLLFIERVGAGRRSAHALCLAHRSNQYPSYETVTLLKGNHRRRIAADTSCGLVPNAAE